MPKASTKNATAASKLGPFFTLRYGARTILVPRPKSYGSATRLAQKHFRSLAGKDLLFQTAEFNTFPGQTVEVTDDIWADAIDSITSLEVKKLVDSSGEGVNANRRSVSSDIVLLPTWRDRAEKKLTVGIRAYSGSTSLPEVCMVDCYPSTPWKRVFDAYGARVGLCENMLTFHFEGETHMDSDENVGDYVLPDEYLGTTAYVYVRRELKGGKPVIYVWTPQPQQVLVNLSLIPQWEFSALYPVAPIIPTKTIQGTGQSATWDVATRDDGTLLDKATGLEVSYLFWEAHTTKALRGRMDSPPVSRPSSPAPMVEAFDPVNASLSDEDSVLLRVADMTTYLDACLRALGHHVAARSDFITYWLPSLLKHEYVALRFVPQESYEQAAPMVVSPAPDVVVRVFMIFQGVSPDEVGFWSAAQARAGDDVAHWRRVVGLTAEDQLQDKSLSRVLEWGGMEVQA
ncbi:hypothetical protein EIP91_000740 [Steccherinum ochraceum]|uniref:Uncharacterized protein n=1 Tax=Steccherinum ochraceum TaxID=92696 RepID=A0A4R0RFC5_9APHY|nr:hypothetical protein EIP91_000740 [Steccherinum ochraceum]